MAQLSPISFFDARRKLIALGFVEATQPGSHVKFVREAEGVVLTAFVPKHREIAVVTLRSILRQAGVSPADWNSQ